MKKIILAFALLLSFSAQAAGFDQAGFEKKMKALFGDGVEIVKVYSDIDISGFHPVHVKNGSKSEIIFGNDSHIILGKMVEFGQGVPSELKTVMDDVVRSNVLDSRFSSSSKAWKKFKSTPTLTEGGGFEVFVAYDPYCHACKQFLKNSRKVVASNKLKINWIPVAFLKSESAELAAKINAGGIKALVNEELYGVLPVGKADPATVAKIKESTRLLFKEFKSTGTPTIFYEHDGVVDFISGSLKGENVKKVMLARSKVK